MLTKTLSDPNGNLAPEPSFETVFDQAVNEAQALSNAPTLGHALQHVMRSFELLGLLSGLDQRDPRVNGLRQDLTYRTRARFSQRS